MRQNDKFHYSNEQEIEDAETIFVFKPSGFDDDILAKIKKYSNTKEFTNEILENSRKYSRWALAGLLAGVIYSLMFKKNVLAGGFIGSLLFGLTGYGLNKYIEKLKTKDDE